MDDVQPFVFSIYLNNPLFIT